MLDFTMILLFKKFENGLIGFLNLKNIDIDIKIIEIGLPGAILWTKTCFVAAILNLSILSGKHLSDVVVPAIFEISALKYPLEQILMLLSGSAHLFHISAPLMSLLDSNVLSWSWAQI